MARRSGGKYSEQNQSPTAGSGLDDDPATEPWMFDEMLQPQAPELRLLLACARAHLTPDDESVIRRLLAAEIDWTGFVHKAVEHGLTALAGHALTRAAPDLVPGDILNAFKIAVGRTSRRNRALFGELADVVDELALNGIEAIPFRGPTLSILAFGSVDLRAFKDLDLFIHAQDATQAIERLRNLGYEPKDQSPHSIQHIQGQKHLSKPATRFSVVLHTGLTAHELACDIDYAGLWQRSRLAEMDGRSIRVLAPADGFVILAVHGGGKMWRRMVSACDVAGFIRLHPQLDWTAVVERAREQGCLRMVLLATSLARIHFDAALPNMIVAAERADPVVQSAVARVSTCWQTENPAGPPSRIDLMRLHEGIWRRVRYAARMLQAPGSPPIRIARNIGALPSRFIHRLVARSKLQTEARTIPLPNTAQLLASPEFFPLKMDEKRGTLAFIQMSRETYRQSPFLDSRSVPSGPSNFSAGLPQLLPGASVHHAERPLHYVLHGALCGSTLLARYIEKLPHSFVLKEPEFLGQLARWKVDASGSNPLGPLAWADWFKVAMALFSRTYPSDTSVIIKPTDLCNWMGDVLLDHDARTKIVFIISPLKQFLISVLKSERRREWVRRRVQTLRSCLAQVPFLSNSSADGLSDGQCAAAIWLYNNFLCGSWLARPDANRILPVRSQNFFAHPKDTLHAVADFLDLTRDEATRIALEDFRPLSNHSKHQNVPYSAARRADILGAAELRFRDEIESALSWARQVGSDTDPRLPFPIE